MAPHIRSRRSVHTLGSVVILVAHCVHSGGEQDRIGDTESFGGDWREKANRRGGDLIPYSA